MCRSGEFVRKIRITPHHHYLAMTKLRSFVSYVSLIAILNHVGQVGQFCSREQLQLLLHSFRQEETPTNWYQKKTGQQQSKLISTTISNKQDKINSSLVCLYI